jgi:phosphate starvation-inducible PhoH-like protein
MVTNIYKNMFILFYFLNTTSIINKMNNNFKSKLIHNSKSIFYPNAIVKRNLHLFMKKEQKHMTPLYKPKGVNQELYCKYLNDNKVNLVLGIGPAGSGKTLFACEKAINELNSGNIQKIILTRPVVSVEEEIGYLPGSIVSKMDPWTKPIMDIFSEYYSQKDIQSMVNSNIIEISPLAFMRGRTFKRSFIIADEMQNSSPNQMLMLITRIGHHSKMVITGDIHQSDRGKDNGLTDILEKLKRFNKHNANSTDTIKLVELNSQDIERSEIVKKIIEVYDFNNNLKDSVPLSINKEDQQKPQSYLNYMVKNSIKKEDERINEINKNESNIIKYKGKKKINDVDASLIPLSEFPRNDFTL